MTSARPGCACVLAMLLLAPRTIVPAETLIDRLWDTRPPPKARESLSVYIARLRASLRQAVGDSVQLAGRARGYVLDVDPEAIDLHQFRRLRRQADALAASGDYDHAAVLLREADGLWRGQALAGIRGDWVGADARQPRGGAPGGHPGAGRVRAGARPARRPGRRASATCWPSTRWTRRSSRTR